MLCMTFVVVQVFTRKNQWPVSISYTLIFYAPALTPPVSLPPLPLLPRLLLYSSSFPLPALTCLNAPLPSLSHSPPSSPQHKWPYFPNNPSAFKRQPPIQKVLGVGWGRRAAQAWGRVRGEEGRGVQGSHSR